MQNEKKGVKDDNVIERADELIRQMSIKTKQEAIFLLEKLLEDSQENPPQAHQCRFLDTQ